LPGAAISPAKHRETGGSLAGFPRWPAVAGKPHRHVGHRSYGVLTFAQLPGFDGAGRDQVKQAMDRASSRGA
jgi:hypothetical protein